MNSADITRLTLFFLITVGQAWCQAPGNAGAEARNLTVGESAASTAHLIGLTSEIERLKNASQNAPAGSPEQWKTLWLHQQIYERVAMVQLQIDATVATIDNEIAHCTEVRGYLADKRDRTVTRANLWSVIIGGGLSGTSSGLGLSSKATEAEAATGIAGGAMAAGLAIYGIHAQRGGSQPLETESNMLAAFFSRPELPTSHYPEVIWEFLDEVPPVDPDHLTRRERLMRTWLELKRLDPPPNTPGGQVKINHITSMPEQHLTLSIDDLEDRAAMLEDVRAKLSYLKRDLGALLASLPEVHPADMPEGAVH